MSCGWLCGGGDANDIVQPLPPTPKDSTQGEITPKNAATKAKQESKATSGASVAASLTAVGTNAEGGNGGAVLALEKVKAMVTQERARLADALLSEAATEEGVCRAPAAARSQFLTLCWLPFLKHLASLTAAIRTRIELHYMHEDRFPLRGRQLVDLKMRNLQLTEKWYGRGKGNVSQVYTWFIKAMELCDVTAFSFDKVPTEQSKDGWATIVDGNVRKSFLKGLQARDKLLTASGSISQKQGESAIDNTTLCNIMDPRFARRLLASRIIRNLLLKLVQVRQRKHLQRVSEHVGLDLAVFSPEVVATVLSNIRAQEAASLGIHAHWLSWQTLRTRGQCIADWGQIPEENKARVMDDLAFRLDHSGPEAPGGRPSAAPAAGDVFAEFLAFCPKHPGQFFGGSKQRHLHLLIAGIWCGRVAVVKRSQMEKFTLAKYLPLAWTRTVPLVNDAGRQIRAAGTQEWSRVRANECPYAHVHAMSLAGGGASEGKITKGVNNQIVLATPSLFELHLPEDPSARLGNWGLTDVEKICNEARLLNPCIGTAVPEPADQPAVSPAAAEACRELLLPGEECCDVGQNPKIGSSIGATQHTQIWRASLLSYKVFQLSSEAGPQRHAKLGGAMLDVVTVGTKRDAVMVKVLCADPTTATIQKFLVSLRFSFLKHYGGADNVDFLVKAMSDGYGRFVVVLVPLAQLEKGGEPLGYHNPLLDMHQAEFGVAMPCIDTGKGAGLFMVDTPQQRADCVEDAKGTLQNLYDFCRCPGARALVEGFIDGWTESTSTAQSVRHFAYTK